MAQYETHTALQMKPQAEALGVPLIFIPEGATGKYQPLDKGTFGALKSKGGAKWRHEFVQHFGKTCTREIEAEVLLQSWSELSDFSLVLAGISPKRSAPMKTPKAQTKISNYE
jgi:hypothetical protein